jgi:hypothetical protein
MWFFPNLLTQLCHSERRRRIYCTPRSFTSFRMTVLASENGLANSESRT